jgi:hypothetical protein
LSEWVKSFRGGRALLNLPGQQSTAAIVAEIEDTSGWGKGEVRGKDHTSDTWVGSLEPDYTLQIANCDRSIQFELEFDTPDQRENCLYKIDTLLEVLSEFRGALVDELERYQDRKEENSKLAAEATE